MSHGGSVDSLHPKGRKRGCSAHIRGHCDYGSKCIYSHDADAVVVCKHHPRCVRGQLCPFLHSAEAAEERQTRGRCFAEIRRGSCDKPSTCSYQHKCQNYSTCTLPQCPHAHEDDESAPKPPTVVSASWGDGSEFGCDRKGRKICANFKLGTCAYGKGCKLSHDDDDLICKHYPDCSRGDNCPFLHTKINPPKPPNKICFNYLRGRLCDTSTCTYLHDTVDATGKPLVIPPCSYPDCSNPRCRFLHATPERGQSRLAGAGLFRHADAQPDADYPPSLPMMDEMAGWTQHDEGPPEMPDLPDEPSAPVWTLATARPLMERLSAVRRMVDALKRQEVARVSAIRAGLQALSNKLESTSELVGDISSTLLQSQEVIDVCTSTLAAVANHKHRQRQRKLRGRRWRPVVRRRACDSDMSVSISDDTPAAKRPRFG